jgi:hypothetical protein
LSFVSVVSSQGSSGNAAGTVTCNLGSLGNGAVATATIVAKSTAPGTITNTVSVASGVTDPLKGNNKASVKTVVQAVQLQVSHSGTSFTFTWPAFASGYSLESTPSMAPPVIWTPVTNPAPQIVNGQYTVTINVSAGTGFFRLRSQGQ